MDLNKELGKVRGRGKPSDTKIGEARREKRRRMHGDMTGGSRGKGKERKGEGDRAGS
jgi:hypothetical protein